MALQGFDSSYYLNAKLAQLQAQSTAWAGKTTADVSAALAAAGYTAESHYLAFGWAEGLNPNAYFNADQYVYNKAVDMHAKGGYNNVLEAQAAFKAAWTTSPYLHYISYGAAEAIDPSVSFDEAAYLTAKLGQLRTADPATWTAASTINDVRAAMANAGITALTHYLSFAVAEGIGGSYPVSSTYTLTNSPDVASANIFNAPRVWNPNGSDTMNSLDDNDQLNGIGTNPTLNFTYSNDAETGDYSIMPQLRGIQTINVAFDTNAPAVASLDLQDSTGLVNLNITRIDDNLGTAQVDNITTTVANIGISNSNAPTAVIDITFLDAALAGTTDALALNLSNVNVAQLIIEENGGAGVANQGYETINLNSAGSANALGVFQAEDLDTLNVTGSQNLTIGAAANTFLVGTTQVEAARYAAGFANVAGSFDTFNAGVTGNVFTGALDVTFGNEINAFRDGTSGVPVAFAITGGSGNDIFRLQSGIALDATDTINGGDGTNTLVLFGGNNLQAGTITNVQALEVRSGHDAGAVADAVVVNTTTANIFGQLATTLIRNEGQAFNVATNRWESAAEGLALTLNSYTDAQAAALTYLHGTTGNNGIANNALTVDFAVDAATNTVGLTFADAPNTDLRFNMQLTSPEANSVTFTDSDTESNTVGLNSFATVNTAITIAGGTAGTYFNLDRAANGFGFDQTGATAGDARLAVAAALTAAPVGTNRSAIDTSVNATYGYGTTVGTSGQYTVFNSVAGGELLVTPTITASGTASDVILRVGAANQRITTGSGNDAVIFADTAGITAATSGLTISDTVAMGAGTDTLILDGRAAAINVGASEWTNLTGVDVLRLGGAAGATAFTATITDQFVDQADNGSNLVIINNDGDLRNVNENVATIDISTMSASNGITFIGADGDGAALQAGKAVQTIVLSDVTANGRSTLDGGDRNIITGYTATEYGTQAAADAAWLANAAANLDGNDNVYRVRSAGTNAEVTVGDLANVTNFSHVQWQNDASVARTMTLTLDDTTVGNLVDASHTANTTARETLQIEAIDSTTVAGATADMIVAAGTVTSSYNLQVLAGRGVDNITTGAGNDTVVMTGNYAAGVYGVDATTGFNINARANALAGAHVVTDTITMGTGTDTLITYGAINLVGATLNGVEAIVANSAVVITLAQWNAMVANAAAAGYTGALITFNGNTTHQLTIVNNVGAAQTIDLSKIALTAGGLNFDLTQVSGTGVGAITGTNAVVDTSSTGDAVPTVIGTNPSNNATLTSQFVNLTAGGTFTGTAGINDIFTGAIATLSGTTITGTAADTETLRLSDAGTVNINNGTTGGLAVTNIDKLELANGTNTISFTGTSGIKDILGGTGADGITVTNMTTGGAVSLGAGNDSLAGMTTAYSTASGATFAGGDGTDSVTFANAADFSAVGAGSLAAFTGFETFNFGTVANVANAITLTNGITGITADTTTGAITITGTGAQFSAITSQTNTNGTQAFNLTVSDAGATANLSGWTFAGTGGGDVDVITFQNSGANNLVIKGSDSAKIVGTAVAAGSTDTLTFTDSGTVTNTVYNAFETIAAATGSTAINITDAGVGVARTIVGNAGANTIDVAIATAAKAVNISSGGSDIVATAATTTAGVTTITGFTAGSGTGFDVFQGDATLVDTNSNITTGTFGIATTGATMGTLDVLALSGASFQVSGALTQVGDAGAVEAAIIAAGLVGSGGDGARYVVLDNGTDTGIYLMTFTDAGANSALTLASEISVTLVGVLSGVADAGTLVAGNFA